jgi:lantibiotic modifying enzyme
MRFAQGAQAALAYERSLFNPQACNWPDLRNSDIDEPVYRVAWCHGAAGIGLTRLRMAQLSDDPALDAEIAAAVGTTVRKGFGRNHSLCHGDLGNLELLFESVRQHNIAISADELETITSRILGSIETTGWRCGTALDVETPGLMVGIAGMGYQLLRLAVTNRVPSVLLLDPPRTD